MENGESATIDYKIKLEPMEFTMSSWLEAWRILNKDCTQVKVTACRFHKLYKLAAEQTRCYELILEKRSIVNDKLIKFITDAEENSGKQFSDCFNLYDEHQEVLDQLTSMTADLSRRSDALARTKLQLHSVREELLHQTSKTSHLSLRLHESKLLAEKLLDRNNKLNERTVELLELHRTRDLMFICKQFDMAQELTTIESKSKIYVDASRHLQRKNNKLQLQQSLKRKKLAKYSSEGRTHKDSDGSPRKFLHIAFHYMCCLWECMAALAHCPQLSRPKNRCPWAFDII